MLLNDSDVEITSCVRFTRPASGLMSVIWLPDPERLRVCSQVICDNAVRLLRPDDCRCR